MAKAVHEYAREHTQAHRSRKAVFSEEMFIDPIITTLLVYVMNVMVMDDKLLTRLELARRWKVSIETIKRRERAKILRPVRLDGRIIRYRMSDVLRIEEEGYDGTADE